MKLEVRIIILGLVILLLGLGTCDFILIPFISTSSSTSSYSGDPIPDNALLGCGSIFFGIVIIIAGLAHMGDDDEWKLKKKEEEE